MFEENEEKAGYFNVDIKSRTTTDEQKANAHIEFFFDKLAFSI